MMDKGFEQKEKIIDILKELGYKVENVEDSLNLVYSIER